MNTTQVTAAQDVRIDCLPVPRARVGMINTAVNRVCEQQFHQYSPAGLLISNTRARVAGRWARPITEMAAEIRLATEFAAECQPDLLVYNCTASSMREGRAGEAAILALMGQASEIPAISTSSVVAEAFKALGVRSVVVLSPYRSNDDIVRYLEESDFRVAHQLAMGLDGIDFGDVTPAQWYQLALEHDRPQADAIFLSCAATTQLEAIEAIERTLGKPVVNSNQAVIWGCIRRLADKLGKLPPMPRLGRLLDAR